MKKNLFILPLVAAMALAGCSKDDGGQKADGTNDYGYVAVNIAQPKTVGVRANTGDFEYGTDDENTAAHGLFFIFNQNGSVRYGEPQLLSLSGDAVQNTNPAVEKIYSAVLVIDGVETNPATQAKLIVCVLNPPAGLESAENLTQLKAMIDDYSISEPNKFIMTNTVYSISGNPALGATIGNDNIAKSAAEALKNPVDIYVERVVAKVKASAVAGLDNKGAATNVEGEPKNFEIKVTGIEIANIAKTSYLFKSIAGIDFADDYIWANDVANKRSYWENSPENLEYANQSYNQITDGFDENASLMQYIQPNTTEQKTAILVTAQLFDGDAPADLVYIRGGYFTNDGAIKLIAQYVANNKFMKLVGTSADGTKEYATLDENDFKWVSKEDPGYDKFTWLHRYEVVAQLKDDAAAIYTREGVDEDGNDNMVVSSVAAVNELLSGAADQKALYKARVYTEGKCYYFVNIDQSPLANGVTAGTYEGVVRNHIYDLALTSIQGIGTPVFNPEYVIIPERPEDETLYYLAARINVLAWKYVGQQIDFK